MRPVLVQEHLPNLVSICQRLVDGILNIPSKGMFDLRRMEITGKTYKKPLQIPQ